MKVFLYSPLLLISSYIYSMEPLSSNQIKETQMTIYKAMDNIETVMLTMLQDLRPHLKTYKKQIESARDLPYPELEKYKREMLLLEKFEKKFVEGFEDTDFEKILDLDEQENNSSTETAIGHPAMQRTVSSFDLSSATRELNTISGIAWIPANCTKLTATTLSLPCSSNSLLHKKIIKPRKLHIRPRSCPPQDMTDVNLNN